MNSVTFGPATVYKDQTSSCSNTSHSLNPELDVPFSIMKQAPSWRADIDSNVPGAYFFLTRSRAELSPLSYFEYRGATSANRDRLTGEWSSWIRYFSSSNRQIHLDLSTFLKSFSKKSISSFWASVASRETQKRDSSLELEQRRKDLRRQNVTQLRMDGDAITRELEAAYHSETSSNPSDDVLLVAEPGSRTAARTAALGDAKASTGRPLSTNTPPAVSTPSNVLPSSSTTFTCRPLPSTAATSSNAALPKISKQAKQPTYTQTKTPLSVPSTPAFTTEEPWHSMTTCLVKIVNGELNVKFPPEQPMSLYHTLLFRLARKSMNDYLRNKREQKGKAKDDPVRHSEANETQVDEESDRKSNANVIDLKDAQVAMSCTLNIMSASCCDYFQEHANGVVQKASALCEIKDFDKHSCLKFLRKYHTPLLNNKAVETLRRRVLRDRADLLDADLCPVVVLQEKLLRILEHLCEFVLHKPYGIQKPSENDCLIVWATIFGVLTKHVTFHTGEKALEASKIMRKMQRAEYGEPSDAGRKVDCVFMFDGIELSNMELKSPNSCPRDVSIQLRKNIRLARCIQELHLSFGVDEAPVIMADIQGFVGTFYRVVQMDDISVAGEVSPTVICLPESAQELEAFIQDESLALIWNFIESLEAQGPVVKASKDRHALDSKKERFRSGLRASPRLCEVPERKFGNLVTLSPAKKRGWVSME